ncbi:hypothetical protein ACWT_4749 [Actinoplanes sp. SE50]|uniref:DUF397 domain-containing protein n=1 Tax=unclassified Actinoplanes TaxID=2626549 RepID=UPI00023EC117|nr:MULTISPECIES: DUF397 domain-containing protein [unclassified Actinoplanes]AEV85771.1 hypothetical protein ACPL_4880 [Actinoplanes sp. SE50/110]ATO84164.1 hypothetical protein ACWT_4749 [Actinoplanes sp. SE50]SLM01574.1 hypothetical protein ACSP50_4810 [Actinoplanes sp. SE50/110]
MDKYHVNLADAQWRKSTKSNANGGCVEIAQVDGFVAIRDSRNPDREPLIFDATEWDCFLDGVAKGEFPVPRP